MTKKNKDLEKLYKKPIPKNMRIDEIRRIVEAHGCIFTTGGNHQYRIVYKGDGWSKVIPIPCHGDTVGEMYIKEIKILIDEITGGVKQ